MRRIIRFSALNILFAVLSLSFAPTLQAGDDIWNSLKEGGKVVLMRHAQVSRGKGLLRDPSCRKEQMLRKKGKEDAKKVGEEFRRHNIQIAAVYHSPYCRTTDTAHIAFGGGQPADYLYVLNALSDEEANKRTALMNEIIGSFTGPGNLVLITHNPNIQAVSFEELKQGEFVVLQPKGGGEFDELGAYHLESNATTRN